MAQVDKIETRFAILRQLSLPTTMEEVEELNLIPRLKAALENTWVLGSGLAAIQIGIPLRFGLIMNGTKEIYLLNPEIVTLKGKKRLKNEGCLSVPDRWSAVPRHEKVRYISDGRTRTARGRLGHIIQHEIDHMDGIVNVDVAYRTWPVQVKK